MKICQTCGCQNSDNAKFCKECGESLSDLNLRCPRCNLIVKSNNKICPKCGYRFTTVSSYETKSISVIDNEKLDEETYLEEQKHLKLKILNKKITTMNDEEYKSIKQERVREYNEDFTASTSKIDSEKMLKIEHIFHYSMILYSFLLSLYAFIVSLLPIVYLNGSDGGLYWYYPYRYIIDKWSVVSDGFKWGLIGNGLAHGFAPILQFIFVLGFIIFSITSAVIILIKGLKCINNRTYRNNFYVYILIDLIISLLMYVAIGMDEDFNMCFPTYYVYLVFAFIYLLLLGGYNLFKAFVINAKLLIARRSLLLISSFFGVLSLIILSFRILEVEGYTYNMHDYLNLLLVNYSTSTNPASFYLGFVGYFLYILEAIFISLSLFYTFKMIRQYNKAKLYSLIYSSFSLVLSIFVYILFTLSTFYSSLSYSFTLTMYPLVIVIFSGINFIISLISFILLKDENIVVVKQINEENK